MRVLVLNAGSSSLKASVIDGDAQLARESVDWGADATVAVDREAGIRRALEALAVGGVPLGSIEAVGHRVVHGGQRFVDPVVVDDGVLEALDELSDLAPLHNPVAIDTIRAARRALPDRPHVACFDTAFHRALPEAVRRYPVPDRWLRGWGIRRYGFHGLSVEWSVGRAAVLLERDATEMRLVVAHLGSGCSVTAVDGGRSVWTSMGMTPLEGLMMGTRAGSIDPGALIELLRQGRLALDELADTLDHGSGLLAVAGSADMRKVVQDADRGDERSRLAIEMFVLRAASGIAGAMTFLDRVDAIVFTAGIGENAGSVRSAIVDRLAAVGVGPIPPTPVDRDAVLSEPDLAPAILRIEAREDLVIARAVVAVAA